MSIAAAVTNRRVAFILCLVVAACAGDPVVPKRAGSERAPTPDRRASLAALRAPFLWIGELHHEAMQEALHDPVAAAFTVHGPASAACAAQLRYMARYAPRVAAHASDASDASNMTPDRIRSIGFRVGACRASATNDFTRDEAPTAISPYVNALTANLRATRSLPAALSSIDSILANALDDPKLSPEDLNTLAAIAVVTSSSATEWYTWSGARPFSPATGGYHATALGQVARASDAFYPSISDIISSDVDGCITGTAAAGTLGCTVGAIGGSVFSW